MCRELTHLRERRIEAAVGEIAFAHEVCKGLCGRKEDLVRNGLCAHKDAAEADAREHVAVVALTRHEGLVADGNRRKGRAAGKEALALRPRVGLGGGVGKRKDHGPSVHFTHRLHNVFGEGAALGAHADDAGGLKLADSLGKVRRVFVGLSKRHLVRGKLVAARAGNKALGIKERNTL